MRASVVAVTVTIGHARGLGRFRPPDRRERRSVAYTTDCRDAHDSLLPWLTYTVIGLDPLQLHVPVRTLTPPA